MTGPLPWEDQRRQDKAAAFAIDYVAVRVVAGLTVWYLAAARWSSPVNRWARADARYVDPMRFSESGFCR